VSRTVDHLIVPFAAFPSSHRALWAKGTTERDRFGGLPYGARLSPYTERSARSGWGRFLATCPLAQRARLPADLVVPATIRRFIAAMELAGNCGSTIANRVCQVSIALRIMCPDKDFTWLVSPGGNNVRSLFHSPRRPIKLYHPMLLYRWGLTLMDRAQQISTPKRRAVQYRDGLMIAIFATRAPRLRSLAAMRCGAHVARHDDRFRIVFGERDLKWKRSSLEYDLPAGLTSGVEHYWALERPNLLKGPDHGWFWVGIYGDPLRERSIETIIRRRSEMRFGEIFGPHRFRHSAGTFAPMADPKRPGAVAAMLGHSKAVSEKAYNFGRQQQVCREFQKSFRQERRRLEGIALRAFGRARKSKRQG